MNPQDPPPNLALTRDEALELKRLVDQHAPALALYARSWCTCPEDAVQEALLELLKQANLPNEPLAWLYQAVRWRAIRFARTDSRRKHHHHKAAEAREHWFEPGPEGPDTGALQAALDKLLPEDRAIVVARIWGEQTLAQIAQALEMPISTVHRKYRIALQQLETLLAVEF